MTVMKAIMAMDSVVMVRFTTEGLNKSHHKEGSCIKFCGKKCLKMLACFELKIT